MGLLDKAKEAAVKAKDLAEKNAPKIASGVDKATNVVDDRTKGKFTKQLRKIDDAAERFAHKAEHADDGDAGEEPDAGGSETQDPDPA